MMMMYVCPCGLKAKSFGLSLGLTLSGLSLDLGVMASGLGLIKIGLVASKKFLGLVLGLTPSWPC